MSLDQSDLLWPLCSLVGELRLLGLWLPPPGRTLRHRLVLAYVVVSHLGCLFGALASIIMDTPSDLPQLSFIAYNCLTDAGLTCKMLSFSLDGQRLTELLRLLSESRQRFPDRAGHRARNHSTAVRMYRVLQVTYRINTAYWLLAPVVRNMVAAVTRKPSISSRDIPVPLWLPFSTRRSPVYETLYALVLAFGWAMSETSVLVDGSLIALLLQVAAELAVLNDNLAGRADTANAAKRAPGAGADEGATDSQLPLRATPTVIEGTLCDSRHRGTSGTDGEVYQHILQNIQHHQTIISCVRLLQKVLSRATCVLLFSNTVSICFQVIATAVEDAETMQTLKILMGSTLYAYQVALFCLLGQTIINQSERLIRSAFSGDWPDGDVRSWHLVHMLCMGTKKSLTLRICGIYTLSRVTLLKILNVSYSLLNFIYQTKAEQSVMNRN